jgi:hypothetical protein
VDRLTEMLAILLCQRGPRMRFSDCVERIGEMRLRRIPKAGGEHVSP